MTHRWLNLAGRKLLPIVQGGMGVGISAHRLAGTVARHNAMGTIASIDLRHHHPDLMAATAKRDKAAIEHANLVALDREVRAAKDLAGGQGMVAVNVMKAVGAHAALVRQAPVLTLQDGLRRMAAREFSLRLPVTSRDEFGTLSTGFNRMAAELQELYRGLEARVAQKTAELARRNRDLETLYDIAAYLNQPNEAEALCRGFLTRIMRRLDADGGSVRMLDAVPENLHMVVSEGLPATLVEQEQRMAADACHCGAATRQRVVAWPSATHALPSPPMACGFGGFAAFRIDTPRGVIGMFSLHFRSPRVLNASDRQLLETLAQHLGVALEHQRLSATARQLAVVQERNLVAQGLHDSIAQGLNYLNLQAQLLEDAVSRGALADVAAIVPMLRCGVDESYQDVRELLLNFRTRLTQGELRQAAEDTVARFRRQCATEVRLEVEGYDNARPLPPDAQLQVLFVLQEALSNVRKHAQAGHVLVRLQGGRDLELVVQDDGEGFDAAGLATRCEMQVGLHIMRERAARLNAQLSIDSAPGRGTRVALRVPGAHVAGEANEATAPNEINEASLQP